MPKTRHRFISRKMKDGRIEKLYSHCCENYDKPVSGHPEWDVSDLSTNELTWESYEFFTIADGQESKTVPINRADLDYLKSMPDGITTNNLLSLPEYPACALGQACPGSR